MCSANSANGHHSSASTLEVASRPQLCPFASHRGCKLMWPLQKGMGGFDMPQKSKQKPNQRRLKKAVPVAGAVGASMALAASGAYATGTVGPAADASAANTASGSQIYLTDEEISDVSLGTFFVFDKELDKPGQQYARGCRACGGCRGCGGCGCRACRACAGCGGCSCGCCVAWGACRFIC
jgi:hypothetical protein